MSAIRASEGRRVAVVGSGISGLTAALSLERAGHHVELIEAADTLGGRLGVNRLGDRPVMLGGKNIGRKYRAFRSFISAFGTYEWEPFGINASTMKDGEVLTLDSSRRQRSLGNVRRMGSVHDLARLGGLAARIRLDERNKFLGSPYFTDLSSKYDHEPLSEHFGRTLTNTLLRPMTVRMNGAEPHEVYLGTFGTNLALLMDTYDQLSDGVQPVLEAISHRFAVRLDTRAEELIVRAGRLVGLKLSSPGKPAVDEFYDGVVVAVPAYAAAELTKSQLPGLSQRLTEVRYFPSTVVLVEYDRPVFTPEVRALAMHDGGPCSNAGSYGMEERHIVRYTFSGRHARGATPSAEQIDKWVGETEERLVHYLGVPHVERVRTLSKAWDAAYCGYLPYHGAFLQAVRSAVAAVPGLELSGDYLWGVSLEACSRAGFDAGRKLALDLTDVMAA